jgi:hypothetical protein
MNNSVFALKTTGLPPGLMQFKNNSQDRRISEQTIAVAMAAFNDSGPAS